MPGKNFIKIPSIIMIIGGVLTLIVSVLGFIGMGTLAAAGVNVGMYTVAVVIALISSVINLVAGISGVSNCENVEKAQKLFTYGIIIIALTVISNVIAVIAGGKFNLLSALTGFILPGLYVYGANLNKNA